MNTVMTIRIPDKLRDRLTDMAQDRGLTRNALVLVILDSWVMKKKQADERAPHQSGGIKL